MTEGDLAAYIPREDLALVQIFELYKDGYVSLEGAKTLAQKYAGSVAHLALWKKLHRNPLSKEK